MVPVPTIACIPPARPLNVPIKAGSIKATAPAIPSAVPSAIPSHFSTGVTTDPPSTVLNRLPTRFPGDIPSGIPWSPAPPFAPPLLSKVSAVHIPLCPAVQAALVPGAEVVPGSAFVAGAEVVPGSAFVPGAAFAAFVPGAEIVPRTGLTTDGFGGWRQHRIIAPGSAEQWGRWLRATARGWTVGTSRTSRDRGGDSGGLDGFNQVLKGDFARRNHPRKLLGHGVVGPGFVASGGYWRMRGRNRCSTGGPAGLCLVR